MGSGSVVVENKEGGDDDPRRLTTFGVDRVRNVAYTALLEIGLTHTDLS